MDRQSSDRQRRQQMSRNICKACLYRHDGPEHQEWCKANPDRDESKVPSDFVGGHHLGRRHPTRRYPPISEWRTRTGRVFMSQGEGSAWSVLTIPMVEFVCTATLAKITLWIDTADAVLDPHEPYEPDGDIPWLCQRAREDAEKCRKLGGVYAEEMANLLESLADALAGKPPLTSR